MNYELKSLIDTICDTISKLGENISSVSGDCGAVVKMDIAQYMMYLSASDGEIKWDEAEAISFYCDLNLTPSTISAFIRENNIYSTDYENTVPVSLQLIVAAANAFNNPDIADGYITMYKMIGEQLIKSDNDVNNNEVSDYNIYINMMERYLDENLDSRKQSVSGFVKKGNSTSAPLKSAVSAPKKG